MRARICFFGAVLYEIDRSIAIPGETIGVVTEAILNRAPVAPVRLT
jgi:hypothetical protein